MVESSESKLPSFTECKCHFELIHQVQALLKLYGMGKKKATLLSNL